MFPKIVRKLALKMPILASLKIDITIIQNCLASKVLIMIVATPNIVLPKRCLVLKMTIANLRTGSVSAWKDTRGNFANKVIILF